MKSMAEFPDDNRILHEVTVHESFCNLFLIVRRNPYKTIMGINAVNSTLDADLY